MEKIDKRARTQDVAQDCLHSETSSVSDFGSVGESSLPGFSPAAGDVGNPDYRKSQTYGDKGRSFLNNTSTKTTPGLIWAVSKGSFY